MGKFYQKDVVNSIEKKKMIHLIKNKGKLLPGVLDSLNLLYKAQISIALASSSSMTFN